MALVVAGIYPVALLFGVLAGLVLHASGTKIEDPKIHITDGDDFVVERSQEIIGKIADLEIHEWVLLKCPGKDKIVKCFYERLVDVTKEWEAPNNTWFVVEHGRILYVQPETGSTEESR